MTADGYDPNSLFPSTADPQPSETYQVENDPLARFSTYTYEVGLDEDYEGEGEESGTEDEGESSEEENTGNENTKEEQAVQQDTGSPPAGNFLGFRTSTAEKIALRKGYQIGSVNKSLLNNTRHAAPTGRTGKRPPSAYRNPRKKNLPTPFSRDSAIHNLKKESTTGVSVIDDDESEYTSSEETSSEEDVAAPPLPPRSGLHSTMGLDI